MQQPPNSGNYVLQDVHGAGAQRSDPKEGNPNDYPHGRGPQGDVIRIYNYVRCVRNAPFPPGDFDNDWDVDVDDFDLFQDCSSGPAVPLTPGCEAKDFDADNDVDQCDFGIFQRCLSGMSVPDPTCAD